MRIINADELRLGKFVEPRTEWHKGWNDALDAVSTQTPTITPDSLVKRGRWEKAVESKLDAHTGEYWEEEYYNCLECDYASDWKSPYCPSCGALMED